MKKRFFVIFSIGLIFIALCGFCKKAAAPQQQPVKAEQTAEKQNSVVPNCPEPERLVNDFAGILGDVQQLEDSLVAIAVATSNQICVVTMNDLGGFEPGQMATEIGKKWGVGDAKRNNGVIILIKPKTAAGKGEAFIAVGTGLESVISNDACTQIVNEQMIPCFKENDYAGGVWAAVRAVRDLAVTKFNEPAK